MWSGPHYSRKNDQEYCIKGLIQVLLLSIISSCFCGFIANLYAEWSGEREKNDRNNLLLSFASPWDSGSIREAEAVEERKKKRNGWNMKSNSTWGICDPRSFDVRRNFIFHTDDILKINDHKIYFSYLATQRGIPFIFICRHNLRYRT